MSKVNPNAPAEAAALSKNVTHKTSAKIAETTQNLFETNKADENKTPDKINSKEVTSPSISEEEARDYAQSLYDAMKGFGANGKTVDGIILNQDLNSYDIVSIINEYADVSGHHFLAKDLASNFMGKHEDKLLQRIFEACMDVYADDSKKNPGLTRRAKEALNEKTMENFMIEQGYAERDNSNIRVSTMATGIRG